MAAPVPPTPVTPVSAEDRTWRVELFTDKGTDYPVALHRERRQYDADGKDVVPPETGNIAPSTTDGGKPKTVTFPISAIMGAVGQARSITVSASPFGPEVSFPLSKIGEIIIAAVEAVAADNKEQRKLYAQLLAEEITQEQYETAIADLIQTEPLV